MTVICKLSFIFIALVHIFQPFLPIDLNPLLFLVTLLFFISAIPKQSNDFRNITLFFLFTGILLLTDSKAPYQTWINSFTSMTNVLAIMLVMQFFAIPIGAGNYSRVVESWLTKNFKKEATLHLFTTLTTHVLACFLLFGTVPVMISLFEKALKSRVQNYEQFATTAVARGYALVTIWAPGAVNVFLVMQVTNMKWTDFFVPSIILAAIGITTSYLFEIWINFKGKTLVSVISTETDSQALSKKVSRQKIKHIALVIIGLVASTIFFEKMKIGTNATRIILAGSLILIAWLSVYIKDEKLVAAIQANWRNGILKSINLAVLFIAMGTFAGGIDSSGVLLYFQPYLQDIATVGGLLSLFIIPLIIIILAMVGIHPFILIVMVGKVLVGLNLPIASESMALCLALGGAVAFLVSPFGNIILMLAKFTNARPIDIALRWNLVFGTIFFIEGIVFSYIWGVYM